MSCLFVAAPVAYRSLLSGCCIQQATRRAGSPLMFTARLLAFELMTKHQVTITICLAALCTVLLLGQSNVLSPEEVVGLDSFSYEWKMHSSQSSSNLLGQTWLYNTKTGKVYRVFERCGPEDDDQGHNGCLSSLPVWTSDRLSDYAPVPGSLTPDIEQ